MACRQNEYNLCKAEKIKKKPNQLATVSHSSPPAMKTKQSQKAPFEKEKKLKEADEVDHGVSVFKDLVSSLLRKIQQRYRQLPAISGRRT